MADRHILCGGGVDDTHEPRPRDSAADLGLACLVLLLGFHQILADPGQLRHALGKAEEADASDLVRLARRLGARSRLSRCNPAKLLTVPLPAIGIDHGGGFFIIAGVRDGQALIQPAVGAPEAVSIADLAQRWSGELVLVTTRAGGGALVQREITAGRLDRARQLSERARTAPKPDGYCEPDAPPEN